ncbi:hypothetical protein NKH77_45645 [Streptomyces sp. M19]
MLFTGKLSLHSHPWLADHVVQGRSSSRHRVRRAGGTRG